MIHYPEPYPLYDQPGEFKDEFDWERSKAMAHKHYVWFITNYKNRLPVLLDYFKYQVSGDAKNDLSELGIKVASCLTLPWCVQQSTLPLIIEKNGTTTLIDEGTVLSQRGCSLAIDMGLFLANTLLDSSISGLRWEFVIKPKNDVNFQSAVLKCHQVIYEPKETSIAKLSSILRGIKDSSAWLEIYNYFEDQCGLKAED